MNESRLDTTADMLAGLAALSQELQRERAKKLNLTLYRLTDKGDVVPVSAREFFANGN